MFGPCVRTITKLFRSTNLKVTFHTNNTMKHHVKMKTRTIDVYNLSRVYQMECKDCSLKYIGQTGRTFRIRYNEHIKEIRKNGQCSKFARHIFDTAHNYNMEETMKILYVGRKWHMLDTSENYYIHVITNKRNNEGHL
jgi:superfamily II DNA/RNA helicase